MEAVLHGFVLAFGLILPLGVQNVFIFSQGITQPTLVRALPATITAALCDTLLIMLAVYGLSFIILQYEGLRLTLMGVGILFLLYMSFAVWRSIPQEHDVKPAISMKKQIVFAISVSFFKSLCHFRYCRCHWHKRTEI